MNKIILVFSLMFLGCTESSDIFAPWPESNEPDKIFTGHPPYIRDTTWVESNSNMTLEWIFGGFTEDEKRPWNYAAVSHERDAIRYGWKSERFELRQGDCVYTDCFRPHKNERIQIGQVIGDNKIDVEYWYGVSFYVPLNYYAGDDFLFVLQFQQFPTWEPLWAFVKNDKEPFCMLRTPTIDRSFYCETGTDFPLIDHQNFAGKWHDVVINAKWSKTDGFTKVWIDGVLLAEYNGQTITSGNEHVMFNYGLYRPSDSNTIVAYFDEVRRGFTREQVDIRFIETQRER